MILTLIPNDPADSASSATPTDPPLPMCLASFRPRHTAPPFQALPSSRPLHLSAAALTRAPPGFRGPQASPTPSLLSSHSGGGGFLSSLGSNKQISSRSVTDFTGRHYLQLTDQSKYLNVVNILFFEKDVLLFKATSFLYHKR